MAITPLLRAVQPKVELRAIRSKAQNAPGDTELPQFVRTAQKSTPGRIYLALSGVAQRQRRHSSFILDALVVVEVNVSVDQIVGFAE